jgi:hypothetical protein
LSNFSIQVQFDQNGLKQFLFGGSYVTLVQQVQGGQPVSWVAFKPTMQNQVTWEDQYAIYVSPPPAPGPPIVGLSQMPAPAGEIYRFENGTFNPQPQPGPGSSYGIRNDSSSPDQLAGGISLQGNVNGMTQGGPITAAPLLPKMQDVFTPTQGVWVFAFLSESGGIFKPPMAGSLGLTMEFSPSQTIHWDSTQQRFVLGPLS